MIDSSPVQALSLVQESGTLRWPPFTVSRVAPRSRWTAVALLAPGSVEQVELVTPAFWRCPSTMTVEVSESVVLDVVVVVVVVVELVSVEVVPVEVVPVVVVSVDVVVPEVVVSEVEVVEVELVVSDVLVSEVLVLLELVVDDEVSLDAVVVVDAGELLVVALPVVVVLEGLVLVDPEEVVDEAFVVDEPQVEGALAPLAVALLSTPNAGATNAVSAARRPSLWDIRTLRFSKRERAYLSARSGGGPLSDLRARAAGCLTGSA